MTVSVTASGPESGERLLVQREQLAPCALGFGLVVVDVAEAGDHTLIRERGLVDAKRKTVGFVPAKNLKPAERYVLDED